MADKYETTREIVSNLTVAATNLTLELIKLEVGTGNKDEILKAFDEYFVDCYDRVLMAYLGRLEFHGFKTEE